VNRETLDEYVARVVAAAPPLTNQQRDRLAELLRPVRRTAPVHNREAAA
jgi:hypothetical protein